MLIVSEQHGDILNSTTRFYSKVLHHMNYVHGVTHADFCKEICVWNISYLKCRYGTRFYNSKYECEVGEKN
jgi:hypothetical protein